MIDYYLDQNYKIEYRFMLFIYFGQKVQLLLFCLILFMIWQRLKLIQNYLIKFLCDQHPNYILRSRMKSMKVQETVNFIGRVSASNNKIRDLASIYCSIGEVYRVINTVYNFIITMTIISSFIFIISTFNTSLSFIKSENDINIFLKIIGWSFVEVLYIVTLSLYCERILKEKEKLKRLLYKILNCNLSRNMHCQTKVFIELIDVWPLTFSVYDMFEINLKMILKFISISTSYLIVVIQINNRI
ncbi:uncharacterized protein [Battus philenor]|uniref:uncharacterized protein n=1 Tax=Battus philenor TaxID=42288 RepID=UPI0035D11DF1